MSQNGEDTVMEDVQGSQAGETEVGDEVPLEKKLFLVCMRLTAPSSLFLRPSEDKLYWN